MGCVLEIGQGKEAQKKPKEEDAKNNVSTIHDFKIGAGDMVVEKSGKINIDYTLLNPPLGKGAYGEVRKAIHKTTQQVRAVKIINKAHTPKEEQLRLKHEVDILRNLDHLNIIKVFEFYQDQRFFYFVTDLCSGGELFDKIIEEKCFTQEKQAAETMKSVLSAVNYCHKEKIMHRDIKPENILYESSKPGALLKLVGFGSSTRFEEGEYFSKRCGTSYYMAPEVVEKRYNEKCDVWSCGVILYILLCGYPPFNATSDQKILEKIKIGHYTMEGDDWLYTSEGAKNLIRRMLEKDVNLRYDAEQALNDEWIKKSCDQQNVDLPILKTSLENMRTFRAGKKLQEATWMFFVNYLATKEEKNDLLKAFQALDTNNDGILSREELVNGFKKFVNAEEAEETVDKIMPIVDKNGTGQIDYTEWVMATINRQNLLSKQRLEMAFKMFDKDGSGSLSLSEIKEMFGGTGAISENVWQDILKEVDDNGDGQIQYREFKLMMMSLSDKALDQKIADQRDLQEENSEEEFEHSKHSQQPNSEQKEINL